MWAELRRRAVCGGATAGGGPGGRGFWEGGAGGRDYGGGGVITGWYRSHPNAQARAAAGLGVRWGDKQKGTVLLWGIGVGVVTPPLHSTCALTVPLGLCPAPTPAFYTLPEVRGSNDRI